MKVPLFVVDQQRPFSLSEAITGVVEEVAKVIGDAAQNRDLYHIPRNCIMITDGSDNPFNFRESPALPPGLPHGDYPGEDAIRAEEILSLFRDVPPLTFVCLDKRGAV